MSTASDQITQYLSVGGLFNPEMMNQTQHEAVRDTLIKARDEIQSLERENAALREALDILTHVIGLTPIAGNKAALQEAFDMARAALRKESQP